MHNRRIIGAALGLLAAILAVVAVGLLPSSGARATHVPVDVAVDMNITGNTASGFTTTHTEVLGTREDCNTIANVGDSLQFDMTVKNVPPFDSNAFTDGITGFAA